MPPKAKRVPDLALRERGNEVFRAGKWQEAVDVYTEAIEKDFDCGDSAHVAALLSNRIAALVHLKEFNIALCDAKAVQRLQPKWSRGYERSASVYKGLYQYLDANGQYAKAGMLSTDGNVKRRMYSAAKDLLDAELPTWDDSIFLNYEQAKQKVNDFDSRLAARTGFDAWRKCEMDWGNACSGALTQNERMEAIWNILDAFTIENRALHFITFETTLEQTRSKMFELYQTNVRRMLPANPAGSLTLAEKMKRLEGVVDSNGWDGCQGARRLLYNYIRFTWFFAASYSIGTGEELAQPLLLDTKKLIERAQAKWPEQVTKVMDEYERNPLEPAMLQEAKVRIMESTLNLVEYERMKLSKSINLETMGAEALDIAIARLSSTSEDEDPRENLARRTRPLIRALLAQAYGLRARAQMKKNLEASQAGNQCIWPNLEMLRTASTLAKKAVELCPQDDLDRIRAMNLALVCDFWVGGMTIEVAFKRVAEVERVKEYISRFYGPCDELSLDTLRIRNICKMIHHNLHLIATNPFVEHSNACYSIPKDREYLFGQTLKACGLVKAKKVGDEVDGKIIAKQDVEWYMGQEIDGDCENWDVYTKEWNDTV